MKAYLFDLDGTLTDARTGLQSSFRAALEALGVSAGTLNLDRFLGSPLPEMFRELKPGISESQIVAGMDAFRRTYEKSGIKDNRLYPGVIEMLEAIDRKGAVSWLVTSKPERYAIQVVEDLKLSKYLKGVVGAGLDETDTKMELINRALEAAKVPREEAVMLGDRNYDIIGAIQNNIFAVGALWGYGSQEELRNAGCRDFAKSPDEFRKKFVDPSSSSKTPTAKVRVAALR